MLYPLMFLAKAIYNLIARKTSLLEWDSVFEEVPFVENLVYGIIFTILLLGSLWLFFLFKGINIFEIIF